MPVLDKNSFIATARRIIPKNFFNIWMPAPPSILSKKCVDLRTKYTKSKLSVSAIRISIVKYSALREINVVIAPAPAINGKDRGTIPTDLEASYLKNSCPKTNSSPRIKSTRAPAIAKEERSTPKTPKRGLPANKNKSIITYATRVILKALKSSPDFCLIEMMIGMEPVISITANNTMNTDNT